MLYIRILVLFNYTYVYIHNRYTPENQQAHPCPAASAAAPLAEAAVAFFAASLISTPIDYNVHT